MRNLVQIARSYFKLFYIFYLPMHYVHILSFQHFNVLIGTNGKK